MKHPYFHIDETARVGRTANDRRMIGAECTIKCVMKPLGGEHRYGVSTASGMYTILLESTLIKMFEPCNAGLANIWRPKRVSR